MVRCWTDLPKANGKQLISKSLELSFSEKWSTFCCICVQCLVQCPKPGPGSHLEQQAPDSAHLLTCIVTPLQPVPAGSFPDYMHNQFWGKFAAAPEKQNGWDCTGKCSACGPLTRQPWHHLCLPLCHTHRKNILCFSLQKSHLKYFKPFEKHTLNSDSEALMSLGPKAF